MRETKCSICGNICTSLHEDIPRYLRPECVALDGAAAVSRINSVIEFARLKESERAHSVGA